MLKGKPSKNMAVGVSSLLAATLLYGMFGVLSRVVGLSIPIFYQNATRSILASLILFVLVSREHSWKQLSAKEWRIVIIRNIMGSIAFLTFFYTVIAVPLGVSYFLFYGALTITGFILGHIWFSEHLTRIKLLSLILAISGMLLVYQVNVSTIPLLYVGLAIISGIATSVWNTMSKFLSDAHSASTISFYDNALSIVSYTALSILFHEPIALPALTVPWAASLSLGVLFVATGNLVVLGFKNLEAQVGSIIMLAEILFAIIFGWVFYHEAVGPLTLIGGAFIVAAIALPEVYSRSK